MKVSIIIPAYNAAATIAETIRSIVGQTVPEWEAIVVNDGSSDATARIARKAAARDPRIRFISQSNGGEAAARNAGIATARYDWLAFLDADDWVAPDYVERLTAALTADATLDAVHCGWARVAADGTESIDNYHPPTGDMFPVLARRAAFAVHACMVRKSLVKAVGGFDVGLKKCPDWDLWQRIARAGGIFGGIPEVLAFYRMAPDSASMDAEQMFRDGLTVLRRGHKTDPRVPNPRPEYADGLPGSTVESQEFYLLSWNAGLLIGVGADARPLLQLVGDAAYSGLYADGVAQSIFDAATLPSCRPSSAWEELWPKIRGVAELFLVALEEKSRAPDLARQALAELKRLVLINSPSWQPLIEQNERACGDLRETVSRLESANRSLGDELEEARGQATALSDRNTELEVALGEAQSRIDGLQSEKTLVEAGFAESRGRVNEREIELAGFRDDVDRSRALIWALENEKTAGVACLEHARQRIQVAERQSAELAVELLAAVRRREVDREERASIGIELERQAWRSGERERRETELARELADAQERAARAELRQVELAQELADAVGRAALAERREAELAQKLTDAVSKTVLVERRGAELTQDLADAVGKGGLAERREAELAQKLTDAASKTVLAERREAELTQDLADAVGRAALGERRESEIAEGLAHANRKTAELRVREAELLRVLDNSQTRIHDLEMGAVYAESDLTEQRQRIARLEQEAGFLACELEKWQRSASERGLLIEDIQQDTWMWLGEALHFVKRRRIAPATLAKTPIPEEPSASDNHEGPPNWDLHVNESCEAHLIFPGEDHEMVCVGITRAKKGADWDIQLNRPGLHVVSGGHYLIVFRARAERPRMIGVGFARAYDPWSSLGMYTKFQLAPEWQSFREEFVAKEDSDNGRIHFDLGGTDVGVDLTGVILQRVDDSSEQTSSGPVMASGKADASHA